MGVQGHPGMTKGREKIAFGDTSVDRCCHLDPCHVSGLAEPTDTSRICRTSSTILPQSAESSGYVCHADPSQVNPTPDHCEVCGFRRGGEKRDRRSGLRQDDIARFGTAVTTLATSVPAQLSYVCRESDVACDTTLRPTPRLVDGPALRIQPTTVMPQSSASC